MSGKRESKTSRTSRKSSGGLAGWWRQHRAWVAGLNRGQKIRYRLFQFLVVLAILIIAVCLAARAWITLPTVPDTPSGTVTGEDGEVLFTTEEESDTLEVGMSASPDGTFTIADGRTVTIADGVITEILDAGASAEEGTENNSGEEGAELENLRAENAELRTNLQNAADIIRDLRSQIKSNYLPGRRVGSQTNSTKGDTKPTSEERKQDIREKLNKSKK